MSGEPDHRMAQVRAQSEHLRTKRKQRVEAYEWAEKKVAAVRGTAATPDGLVRVTVDQTGMVTQVELSPRVRDAKPADLARTITAVAQQAVAHARDQIRDVYGDLLNEGMVKSIPSHLPESPVVPEASMALELQEPRHRRGVPGSTGTTHTSPSGGGVDVERSGKGKKIDDDGPPVTWLDTRSWY